MAAKTLTTKITNCADCPYSADLNFLRDTKSNKTICTLTQQRLVYSINFYHERQFDIPDNCPLPNAVD